MYPDHSTVFRFNVKLGTTDVMSINYDTQMQPRL
jgi:hypothetical protein